MKDISIKGIVASDLPLSEVVNTLTKRVFNSELNTPEYKYVLTHIFGMENVFDGLKDVNYEELHTTDSTDPYANTVVDDFNGETNKVIRDTVEAKDVSNVKTKILNEVLHNFKANPADAVKTVFINTQNITKQQEKFREVLMWNIIRNNAGVKKVDITGLPDVASSGESVNKLIFKTIETYKTTSKTHFAVGAGGVITTSDGNTIQPAKRFDSTDWYLIESVDLKSNTTYDGEKVFLNWNSGSMELAGVITLNFNKYEPLDGSLDFSTTDAILIHKDAFLNVVDWIGTGIASSGKLYSIIHNYMKLSAYKRLDKPIVIFEEVVIALNSKSISKENKESIEKHREWVKQNLKDSEVKDLEKEEIEKQKQEIEKQKQDLVKANELSTKQKTDLEKANKEIDKLKKSEKK